MGVLLLLFVPGIRVVQYRTDRENERSIKKLRLATAETVRALRAHLEQVILRIRLRREPGTLLLTLRVPKRRLSVRESSLPKISLLTELRIRKVGSRKARPVEAHRPRERRPTEADKCRERRLTKVGALRECRVSEVRVLREVHVIARPYNRKKTRPAERGVAVEPCPTKILVLREGRPAKVRRAHKAYVAEHCGLLGGYTGKARDPAEQRLGEHRRTVEDRRGEVCFIVERGGGEYCLSVEGDRREAGYACGVQAREVGIGVERRYREVSRSREDRV